MIQVEGDLAQPVSAELRKQGQGTNRLSQERNSRSPKPQTNTPM